MEYVFEYGEYPNVEREVTLKFEDDVTARSYAETTGADYAYELGDENLNPRDIGYKKSK